MQAPSRMMRDAVGMRRRARRAGGHQDDHAARIGQRVDAPEQVGRLLVGERGVGLVEQEDPRVARERPPDLRRAAAPRAARGPAGRSATSRIARSARSAALLVVRAGDAARACPRGRPSGSRPRSGWGTAAAPGGPRRPRSRSRRADPRCGSSSRISPASARGLAREDLDERALARAVGPGDAQDLARARVEVEAVEGPRVAVPLAQARRIARARRGAGRGVGRVGRVASSRAHRRRRLGEAVEHDGRDGHRARHEVG